MGRIALQRVVEGRYRVKIDNLTDIDIAMIGEKIVMDIQKLRDAKKRDMKIGNNINDHLDYIKTHIKQIEDWLKV